MATEKRGRARAGVFKWLRAIVFAAILLYALQRMPFYPAALSALIALGAAALSLVSPGIGVVAVIIALTPPIAASNIIVGAIFLVVGLSATKYLAEDDAAVFLVIALAFIGSRLGVGWAFAALAGYVLGASEGAIAALVACAVLEVAGVLTGVPAAGILATGGSDAGRVLAFGTAPEGALAFSWVVPAAKAVEPQRIADSFSSVSHVALLVVQPLLWAGAAAVAGALRRGPDDPRRAITGLGVGALATTLLAGTSIAAMTLLNGPAGLAGMLSAAGLSLAVTLAGIAAWEWVFPPLPPRPAAEKPGPAATGMSAEDADVDELLRLIATAEEELATKHTVETTVMITDMMSFSRMTEEDGSVVSAKMIQRHRDLLLPVIDRHGGHGKSTGGDGLVAAFPTPADALSAAVEMQRALASYNTSRPSEREITIRIGVATGEVVLDKRGRPFIGTALNLAARVMGLADGGQVMTTSDLLEAAGKDEFRSESHGPFELKNIAEPVEVAEVLWSDGQVAKPPPIAPQTG